MGRTAAASMARIAALRSILMKGLRGDRAGPAGVRVFRESELQLAVGPGTKNAATAEIVFHRIWPVFDRRPCGERLIASPVWRADLPESRKLVLPAGNLGSSRAPASTLQIATLLRPRIVLPGIRGAGAPPPAHEMPCSATGFGIDGRVFDRPVPKIVPNTQPNLFCRSKTLRPR